MTVNVIFIYFLYHRTSNIRIWESSDCVICHSGGSVNIGGSSGCNCNAQSADKDGPAWL